MNETLRNSEVFLSTQLKSDYTWLDKVISKTDSNLFRLSILLTIVSSLGISLFTFHKIFDDIGIINSIIIILFLSFNFIISSDIMIYSLRFATNVNSISDVIEAILGKFARVIYDINLIGYLLLNLYSTILAFMLLSYHLFGKVFNSAFGIEDNFRNFKRIFLLFTFGFFLLVFLNNHFKSLQYASFFSIITFVYVFLLTLIQFPDFYMNVYNKDIEYSYNYTDLNFSKLVKSISIITFAFNFLTQFFSRLCLMGNQRVKNLQKIFKRSLVLISFVFIIIGMVGYLSLGPETHKFIFYFMRDYKDVYDSDYFMLVGNLFLLLSFFISFGIFSQPLKKIFYKFFKEKKKCVNFLVSLFFTLCLFVLCFFLDLELDIIFMVNGFFPCVFLVWIFPALLAIKIKYVRRWYKVLLLYIWIVFGVVFFISGFLGFFL